VIPVTYTAASQAIVDAYDAKPKVEKSSDYWSDNAVAPVKKEAKDHYIAQQNYRCAYCKQPVYTGNNAVWDAEHIISKRLNPEFMFEPQNLAISCKDCNLAKGEQEVRKTKKLSFPRTSAEYRIVHPHYDNYDDHIRWMGPVCVAISAEKGSSTISMCNLTRYSTIRINELQNIMDDDFNRLMGQLLEAKSIQQGKIALAGIMTVLEEKLTQSASNSSSL
jgi:uncharacterized protein (TIGR02646 family)